jgi:hypothetical protein
MYYLSQESIRQFLAPLKVIINDEGTDITFQGYEARYDLLPLILGRPISFIEDNGEKTRYNPTQFDNKRPIPKIYYSNQSISISEMKALFKIFSNLEYFSEAFTVSKFVNGQCSTYPASETKALLFRFLQNQAQEWPENITVYCHNVKLSFSDAKNVLNTDSKSCSGILGLIYLSQSQGDSNLEEISYRPRLS